MGVAVSQSYAGCSEKVLNFCEAWLGALGLQKGLWPEEGALKTGEGWLGILTLQHPSSGKVTRCEDQVRYLSS